MLATVVPSAIVVIAAHTMLLAGVRLPVVAMIAVIGRGASSRRDSYNSAEKKDSQS